MDSQPFEQLREEAGGREVTYYSSAAVVVGFCRRRALRAAHSLQSSPLLGEPYTSTSLYLLLLKISPEELLLAPSAALVAPEHMKKGDPFRWFSLMSSTLLLLVTSNAPQLVVLLLSPIRHVLRGTSNFEAPGHASGPGSCAPAHSATSPCPRAAIGAAPRGPTSWIMLSRLRGGSGYQTAARHSAIA